MMLESLCRSVWSGVTAIDESQLGGVLWNLY